LRDAHDRVSASPDVRYRKFRVWELDPEWGDALTSTLIALGLHCLTRDAEARGENSGTDFVRNAALADLVETLSKRPAHELLAGLPDDLSDRDVRLTQYFRLLIHHVDGTAALQLERLSLIACRTLLDLSARLPQTEPTLRDALGDHG